MDKKIFFVTGIGTDVGKTIVSAILAEALHADYWKPVQCGDLDNSDTDKVRGLITNPVSVFHPERYRLKEPMSPHAAARRENIEINISDFVLPETDNTLIIEAAGGIMVPLNEESLVLDLILKFDTPVILVSRNYLGSINHTLLSIGMLRQRNILIEGIIFNGFPNPETEEIVEKISGVPILGRVDEVVQPDQTFILEEARKFTFLSNGSRK